jgi:hypothetical protein
MRLRPAALAVLLAACGSADDVQCAYSYPCSEFANLTTVLAASTSDILEIHLKVCVESGCQESGAIASHGAAGACVGVSGIACTLQYQDGGAWTLSLEIDAVAIRAPEAARDGDRVSVEVYRVDTNESLFSANRLLRVTERDPGCDLPLCMDYGLAYASS